MAYLDYMVPAPQQHAWLKSTGFMPSALSEAHRSSVFARLSCSVQTDTCSRTRSLPRIEFVNWPVTSDTSVIALHRHQWRRRTLPGVAIDRIASAHALACSSGAVTAS